MPRAEGRRMSHRTASCRARHPAVGRCGRRGYDDCATPPPHRPVPPRRRPPLFSSPRTGDPMAVPRKAALLLIPAAVLALAATGTFRDADLLASAPTPAPTPAVDPVRDFSL